jgi:uncharacterized protein YoxC
MSTQGPAPTSPLRILAGITCIAVTVCAVSLTILAWQAIGTRNDVQRAVDRVDTASQDLDPAVRDLRRAARQLRQAASSVRTFAQPASP